MAQVFSCEFCEISNNTYFYRAPPVGASESENQDNYYLGLGQKV